MANIEYAEFINNVTTTSTSLNTTTDYVPVKRVDNTVEKTLFGSPTDILTGTSSAKFVSPDALASLWEQGANIASAGTLSIGEGGYFHVTGTTTITDIDFATDKAGRPVVLVFDGILTLTHSSTLILPTGANIVTAAGDRAICNSEGSDVVRVFYMRASGAAVGGILGSGTTNRISKWTSSTVLGDSLLASNTTDVSPSAAGTIALGTNALPFTDLYVGAAATNNIRLTGTATAARVATLQDATGTVALTDPRVNTITSSSTPTPNSDTTDIFTVTALATNATFGAPTGTPVNGRSLIIRILDDGTARTLAYNAIYRALGVILPTTTTISKTMYLAIIYNSAATKWDIVGVREEV